MEGGGPRPPLQDHSVVGVHLNGVPGASSILI